MQALIILTLISKRSHQHKNLHLQRDLHSANGKLFALPMRYPTMMQGNQPIQDYMAVATFRSNEPQEFFESVANQHFQKILGSGLSAKRCKTRIV